MRLKQHNNISESQVEDALVSNLFYLKKLLNLSNDLRLIARQLRLKSGEKIIDLLVADGKDLCLIELKVTKYSNDFLNQIIEYKKELIQLQNQGKVVNGRIKSFLLITKATKEQIKKSNQNDVELIVYEPLDLMKDYYRSFSAVATFLNIKPNDYGVFSLGLINRALLELGKGISKQTVIADKIGLSKG